MSQEVDTNGWHTVAAINYADVNKAIAKAGNGPTRFDMTADNGSGSISGTFDTWCLTTGGSGQILKMNLPITGGEVKIGDASYTISPCTAEIAITAQYIPQDGTSLVNLVPSTSQTVTVDSLKPKQTKEMANSVLRDLLEDWLNQNASQFNAIFASVDLDAKYTNDGVNWLKPSFKGYAVAEPSQNATESNCVFAVLTLIDETPEPPGLVWQVSPFVIPQDAAAGFVIQEEMFLKHMMLTAVPAMFKDIASDSPNAHFTIDNLGKRIRNTGSVTLLPVTLDNGNVVTPTVDDSMFSIELDGGELKIEITDMQFEYSPGITVHLNYSGNATISLDTTNKILQMSVTKQSGSGSVEVSKGMQIAEIVLGVASIVLALVGGLGSTVGRTAEAAVETATTAALGAADAGAEDAAEAAEATVTCCRGLITGTPVEVSQIAARCFTVAKVAGIAAFCTTLMPVTTQILNAIAEGNYQAMPKITDLTSGAVGETVIWPKEVGAYELGSAQLSGAFQFGLNRAAQG